MKIINPKETEGFENDHKKYDNETKLELHWLIRWNNNKNGQKQTIVIVFKQINWNVNPNWLLLTLLFRTKMNRRGEQKLAIQKYGFNENGIW